MAINLWEQSGKPTGFSPLPSGYGTWVGLNPLNEYVIKFKAKSPSGASIRVQNYDKFIQVWKLTNEFREFETLAKVTSEVKPGLYIYDVDGIGDIEVKDINVVEKPLGKATINMVDHFLSGKWNIHANAKAIDAETLELNATTGTQESYIDIPVEFGKSYSFSIGESTGAIYGGYYASNGGWLSNYGNGLQMPNNVVIPMTIPNVAFFRIRLGNGGVAGKYTFKKPMFNLGVSVPYESKRGDRPIEPVVNNLIPLYTSEWLQGSRNAGNTITPQTVRVTLKNLYPIDPLKAYRMNTGVNHKVGYFLFDENKNIIVNSGWVTGNLIIQPTAEIRYIAFNLARVDDATITPDDVVNAQPKLFTEFQQNKIPIKTISVGKNKFAGYEDGYLNSGTYNEKPLSGSNGQRTSLWMECQQNTKYTLSGGDRSSWHFKNVRGEIFAGDVGESITAPFGAVLMRVYYSSDGTHGFPQIEKGELSFYEKPIRGAKKAIGFKTKKNLFNPETITPNTYIFATTGAVVNSGVGNSSTDFIPVVAGKKYSLTNVQSNGTSVSTSGAFYDKNKVYITGMIYPTNQTREDFTAPANAEYVRFTINNKGEGVQMEEGERTEYEPYTLVGAKKVLNGVVDKNKVDEIQKWEGTWLNSTIQKTSDYVRLILDVSKQAPSSINSINFTFPIVTGKKYTVSFDVRASRIGSIPNYTYIMKGVNGGGNKSLSSLFNPVGTEWTRQSLTFIAETTVNDAYLMVGFAVNATTGTTTGDTMDFKNVQFEEGDLSEYEPFRYKPNLAKR
jgi:hypothetical protein